MRDVSTPPRIFKSRMRCKQCRLGAVVEWISDTARTVSGTMNWERTTLPINTGRPRLSRSNPAARLASRYAEHFFNYLFYLKLRDRNRHGQKYRRATIGLFIEPVVHANRRTCARRRRRYIRSALQDRGRRRRLESTQSRGVNSLKKKCVEDKKK